jgi:hypothetical protein
MQTHPQDGLTQANLAQLTVAHEQLKALLASALPKPSPVITTNADSENTDLLDINNW